MQHENIFRNDLFSEKKILVTGATSGIGYESVKNLSRLGADLILTGRSLEKLNKIKNSLGNNSKVFIIPKDLSEKNAGNCLIKSLPDEWLPLNGMFHAAGDILIKPLSLSERGDYDYLAQISLHTLLEMTKFISKKKYFANGSSIVLMSSVASILGTTGLAYYSAIKSSINSICNSMAIELANKSIRVNTILAGAVETDMHRKISERLSNEFLEKYESKHLLGFGKAEDISHVVTFLLSPASKWITGTSLTVDGGFSSFK
tara:strand:+ start:1318 stop:2097 length:780 start_codon:yes stop_codon:yes gene_type:complete